MIRRSFMIPAAAILLCLFAIVSVASAVRESLTFDEIVHIEEGIAALKEHRFIVDTNNPPLIRELAVVPLLSGMQSYIPVKTPNMQVLPARLVIVGLAVLLGIAVYFTAGFLFGPEAGLFALFLYVFDPNILAHAHLVTLDAGAALFFFLGYVSSLWLMHKRTWTAFALHGVSMGLMASSKITTLPYYAIANTLAVPFVLGNDAVSWFRRYFGRIAVSAGIFILVTWSSYFFTLNVIVAPGDAQGRVSTAVRQEAEKRGYGAVVGLLNFLEKTPVPLGDYVGVIKNTWVRSMQPSELYFQGQTYRTPAWYFMIVNVFYKTPVPLLLFALLGSIAGLGHPNTRRSVFLMAFPIAGVLIAASASRMQPLVRYVLPMYPFLAVLGGAAVNAAGTAGRKTVLFCLALWYLAGTMSFFPHFIAYANGFAGPRNLLFTRFTDSNLDWGQSLPDVKAYIDATRPAAVRFSYFGRDDAAAYGIRSANPFGSYKFNEICAMHDVSVAALQPGGNVITAISASNWFWCGYRHDPLYSPARVRAVVGESILIF